MTPSLIILAQEAAPAGGAAGGGMGMLVPMILIFALFYFVLIRPQRKQAKAQEEMRNNLAVGDKVVTIGGIHGLVSGMTDKTVSVKISDGLSVKFDRTAIANVTDSKAKGDDKATADKDSGEGDENGEKADS